MFCPGPVYSTHLIYGVRAKRNRLDHVRARTNRTADHNGNVVADSLVAKTLVNGRKRQFNRNAYVIADARRRGAGAAAETVDCNDVRAASCNAAGNGRHLSLIHI